MTPKLFAYIRHLSKRDRKSLTQKTLKTVEEVGEMAKVVLPYENAYATTHRFIERERILEEAVDTTLSALSVAYDLDFTDDEIEEMMVRKAEKWAGLQAKEDKVTYPLPFEIHITVNLHESPIRALRQYDGVEPVDIFRQVCKELGVKPIILDLQGKEGTSVMTDVMTSSKHFGDNRSAYLAVDQLYSDLYLRGFSVVRSKIETVPWHPAAPQNHGDKMPPSCYFEAHIPLTLCADQQIDCIKHVTDKLQFNVHTSRNVYKRNDDGSYVVMLTFRTDAMIANEFQETVEEMKTVLSTYFTIGKIHTEFAVYDTKVSHDATWLKG